MAHPKQGLTDADRYSSSLLFEVYPTYTNVLSTDSRRFLKRYSNCIGNSTEVILLCHSYGLMLASEDCGYPPHRVVHGHTGYRTNADRRLADVVVGAVTFAH